MKAFVAGATGETGQCIVQELVQRGIPIRALVRNLEHGQKLLPLEAELVVGDVLQPQRLEEAMGDSTIAFSAIGARPSLDPSGPYQVDCRGNQNLIDTARAKGIEHFVLVSSLCTSRLLHPLNLFWLVLHWKKRAEDYLQQSGLTYTIVRPGGLRNQDAPDAIVMSPADTLTDGSIPRAKVAQTCVEAPFQPAAANTIVEIVARQDAPAQQWPQLFAQATGSA
ncbi:MAG: epimerase [Cyanobacteria bacterium QS_8_64_29]|nr:MAG: epimerase [Cyanobacteria bacterium QS_8_64_29]